MKTLLSVLVLLALAAPLRAEEEDLPKAREHARKAARAYDLGRYLEAAKHYEAAYELHDDPALLFNSAQAYRLGGSYADALRAYKSFLRRSPKAHNRPEVEAKIAELQKTVDQQSRAKEGPPEGLQAPAPSVATPATTTSIVTVKRDEPEKKTPLYKKWWLWTAVGGVAAAGLAVGLGVGLTRHSSSSFDPTLPGFSKTSGLGVSF